MIDVTADLTVRKSVSVARSVEDAFSLFTQAMATWWPLARYSVNEERTETVTVEGRVGGRVYERAADGSEAEWARVTAWEPPHRLGLSWYPGQDASAATDVEVRFTADGDGTRVDLEHSGWERLGENARAASDGYRGGWDEVLARYVEAA